MADPLTPQVSERICKHMNEDHADALALYARVFGQVEGVTQARMQAIDSEGMDLQVEVDGAVQTLRISFDHPLKDSEDAHHTLIAMLKQARAWVKQGSV
jgi:putative heme iron utilization protein